MIQRIPYPSRPTFRPGTDGVRAVLLGLVIGFGTSSCTPVGVTRAEPAPAPPSIPPLEQGRVSPALEAEAGRALEEARRLLAASAFSEAKEAALGVLRNYPGVRGSGEGLRIQARAALGLGETAEAVEASRQFLNLLDPLHPEFPGAALLQAEALAEDGDPGASISSLLLIPGEASSEVLESGVDLLREVVGSLETEGLRDLTNALEAAHPFRGVAATELAVSLFLSGEEDEARVLAESALAGNLDSRERVRCRGILDGDLEEVLGQPLVLGAILPQSGVSPGLMEYGAWILEGIQVAVEEYQGTLRRPVRLEVSDNQGSPSLTREAVGILEAMGAVGAVGPLSQDLLVEAAEARGSVIPLISPFAPLPPDDAEGVLSLSGPDPGGAEVVARYAWDLGLNRVVILRPRTEEAALDSEVFREAYSGFGGSVPREVVYESGATFFQAEFNEVGSVLPDGLFLPLTARDIQLLAPQFTYYGLDTLGIQLLGTRGWTDDAVVLDVDSRHTDGVIASTTRISQDETEALRRFRLRYEALFQRSLRSEIPAYGYDAAVLILEGLREGPRTSADLLRAIRRTRDFPGATGHLTVEGDRIRRVPQLVRIQDHELIYISSHIH
ncbi:MAG: ABC transporter substrate-binding protein [Gemmatimonadetes bacterium]|nr:ABC transporter substrate-binding protein [Gemmatimonadota bacterium]NNM04152.1 ABC transporter substrate-binding protein [Gemmatimonadota bacterium]